MSDTSSHPDPVLLYTIWTSMHEERVKAALLARERAERLGPPPRRRERRRRLRRRTS